MFLSKTNWDSAQDDLKHITWVAELKCGIFFLADSVMN